MFSFCYGFFLAIAVFECASCLRRSWAVRGREPDLGQLRAPTVSPAPTPSRVPRRVSWTEGQRSPNCESLLASVSFHLALGCAAMWFYPSPLQLPCSGTKGGRQKGFLLQSLFDDSAWVGPGTCRSRQSWSTPGTRAPGPMVPLLQLTPRGTEGCTRLWVALQSADTSRHHGVGLRPFPVLLALSSYRLFFATLWCDKNIFVVIFWKEVERSVLDFPSLRAVILKLESPSFAP